MVSTLPARLAAAIAAPSLALAALAPPAIAAGPLPRLEIPQSCGSAIADVPTLSEPAWKHPSRGTAPDVAATTAPIGNSFRDAETPTAPPHATTETAPAQWLMTLSFGLILAATGVLLFAAARGRRRRG